MSAALARLRSIWETTPAADFPSPAVRAAARAYDAVHSTPGTLTRRGYIARTARLRWKLETVADRIDDELLAVVAKYRREMTIAGASLRAKDREIQELKDELDRVKAIAVASGQGHIFAVRVPEQWDGARS